ncbi:hypothetical protein SHM7688_00551 [Shimia marina]|uniref:Uncharacterized protein n=1 Tax=Shimia marina TaxID=321267 RepID=A0A0P1EKY7_9RHOB|nr:hypothetical protein SHM7688_00551 [Shimia marina]
MITICHRIRQPAQHNHACARAKHRALRAVVKRVTGTIGRQDFTVFKDIAPPMRQFDGHAARKRHVAFAIQQRLRPIMHRHKRGRTGGLHPKARSLEIQNMAEAGGQEILVVAGVTQQEHAGAVHQIAV